MGSICWGLTSALNGVPEMEQKNLARAQSIVEGIAWCRNALTFIDPSGHGIQIRLTKPNPGSAYPTIQDFALSPAIREQAFKMFRCEVESKMAAYRRSAAQIGLKLED